VAPPSLNVVSIGAIDTIPVPLVRAATTFVATSIDDLGRALEVQATRPRLPALAIDLVGHSTRDHHLLRLGATIIDALDLGVLRYFERIARSGILRELNVSCLRLLGCETSITPSGQRTMRLLASVLQMPVYGSRKRLSRMHHSDAGFDDRFVHVLDEAAYRRPPEQLVAPLG